MNKTILVIEDELSIRSFVCFNLRKKQFHILEAKTGEEALELFYDNQVDIVLLDLMLPGIDGFTVCDEIRRNSQTVGIIMLTARTQEEDRVKGLIQGADDYLSKPFSMVELEARIISLLRRLEYVAPIEKHSILQADTIVLNQMNKTVTCQGHDINVTPTEFCLLQLFLSNTNKLFTRDNLLDEVWGVNYIGDVKVVDVNIRRLRMKIEADPSNPTFLCTVWGQGYIWKG